MKISYSTNNSGGNWWLEDEDWYALEKAGWKVKWVADEMDNKLLDRGKKRWLGTLAKEAEKDFKTPKEAMEEFEKITGQNVMDEGCNCCGAPHSFNWNNTWVSGEDCKEYLFGEKRSLRELLEANK